MGHYAISRRDGNGEGLFWTMWLRFETDIGGNIRLQWCDSKASATRFCPSDLEEVKALATGLNTMFGERGENPVKATWIDSLEE